MPAAEPPIVSTESGPLKMDDRKRPAADNNDSAPPLKKQATSVNGGSKPHPDADMPWKDDLERIQKDAILRQMQEYKREKVALEARVSQMSKTASDHNDRLRVIDSWFCQFLDEIKLLLGPSNDLTNDHAFKSSLQFDDNDAFETHLKARSDDIRQIISQFQSKIADVSPDITDLQGQLAKKLAEEKVHISELEKTLAEKQQLEESLETASLRYMMAEKKLDRARSVTAAKLEKGYIMGNQRPSSEGAQTKREESSPANGGTPSGERSAELEETNNQLTAVSEKQKEQLQKLETENASLLTQITEVKVKYSKLTDDDYAQTDLFKQLRSQYDDVTQVEDEARGTIAEKDSQLVRAETDLARIRNARDELLADLQMRKASHDQEKTSGSKLQELADAREARISALESEAERLRLQIEGSKSSDSVEDMPLDDLRAKYTSLERQYAMLNTELTSMQMAYKKFSTLASQKVIDFSALEEKITRLTAEKSKADQKYFAAMKSKEARETEVRTLRIQNSKTSDIVAQLKDSESTTRSLLSNMEKQASEAKEALAAIQDKHRSTQQQMTESNIVMEGLKAQIAELKAISISKDSTLGNTSTALRQAETEIVSLKQSLADTKKSLENWKGKSLGNNSSEYEMLRTLALCTVCRRNFKNTAIKTCGHVFCKDCVEERLTSRSRKCPNCNKSFGSNDHMHITL
ncbi:hypothetical protein N7493_007235 [Penicillium malachiteum]|uniref:E3 ubiquitin protein ligase n=1 Tax=Penicillium malachiteum TaxID=1324776 RepID=A0AAD6HJ79_9EURO|nr:hypothetical protein N7493_007235 [Penicillium malachiteum]